MSLEISPQILQQWQQDKVPFQILDVREPDEFSIVNIQGTNIPLMTLSNHVAELDKDVTWVTLCHHGRRSYMAAEFLKSEGFQHVYSLAGGIDRWTCEIAPHLPRY